MDVPDPVITPEILQQNPILLMAILAFMLGLISLLSGSLVCWILLSIRKYKGLAILPIQPWSPRTWGLADLILVLVMVVLSQFVGVYILAPMLGIDIGQLTNDSLPLSLSAAISGCYMFVVLLSTIWIILRFAVNPGHVGFTTNFWYVTKVGFIAGLVLLPVIYLGNLVVALGFTVKYKHPLLEAMLSDGSLNSYLLAVFAAAIAAPVAEEFLFRVVLQGWLQSIPFSSLGSILLGANASQRSDPENELFYHPSCRTDEHPTAIPTPTAATDVKSEATGKEQTGEQTEEGGESSDRVAQIRNAGGPSPYQLGISPTDMFSPNTSSAKLVENLTPHWWPSVVAGILFGLAHWGYGLSFIPLSVLGICLGLIYRATHSIWPCIIVHFMLNSSSMMALGVTILINQYSGE